MERVLIICFVSPEVAFVHPSLSVMPFPFQRTVSVSSSSTRSTSGSLLGSLRVPENPLVNNDQLIICFFEDPGFPQPSPLKTLVWDGDS